MNQKNINEAPIIGITCGDSNGVGPELIIDIFSDNRILKYCTPVIYGNSKIFSKYRKLLHNQKFNFTVIDNISKLTKKRVNFIEVDQSDSEIEPGKITKESGQIALKALQRATQDALDGHIQALVTAPINKDNIQSENFKFPGHTEYLAEKNNVKDHLMLMTSDDLKIGVVTGHIPLKFVSEQISAESIIKKAKVLHASLKNDFGVIRPKIAILGLNPHAGENGLLGQEDIDVIIPAINKLKEEENILAFGPLGADGFFGTQQYKNYDGVLAMYHDQGLIPFKTLAFDRGVNFTAGLSIIRTSPDHGTAYDLAGKGTADTGSMREAIYAAIDIYHARKGVKATYNNEVLESENKGNH